MQDSPKNLYKKLLGLKGEKVAEKALKKQGYKVLVNNYVTPFGEADLVCEKNGSLFFVEVKTRSSNKFGTPAQAVDYRKHDVSVSFIVVEVLGEVVNIITDAF